MVRVPCLYTARRGVSPGPTPSRRTDDACRRHLHARTASTPARPWRREVNLPAPRFRMQCSPASRLRRAPLSSDCAVRCPASRPYRRHPTDDVAPVHEMSHFLIQSGSARSRSDHDSCPTWARGGHFLVGCLARAAHEVIYGTGCVELQEICFHLFCGPVRAGPNRTIGRPRSWGK